MVEEPGEDSRINRGYQLFKGWLTPRDVWRDVAVLLLRDFRGACQTFGPEAFTTCTPGKIFTSYQAVLLLRDVVLACQAPCIQILAAYFGATIHSKIS
jgi:hypothetical protein